MQTTTLENQTVANTAARADAEASPPLLDDATATYSPEDNKLRLYAGARLEPELYSRVRDAGFIWAPKQELFVAPMWTPGREDLLIELCGEIGDESVSLADRQAARAKRFGDYSVKRKAEAESAYKVVGDVAKRFEFGQPILVGHHSERAARKDKERIEAGMRRAVNLWDTSAYWTYRAAGSLGHALHKEAPGVRHRRIKGIEADKRKREKAVKESASFLAMWEKEGLTLTRAMGIANYDHISKCFTLAEFPRVAPASQYEGMTSLWSAMDGGIINEHQAQEIAVRVHRRMQTRAARWIGHYENRIIFEKAMLGESGGIAADKFDIQPGGRVLVRNEWLTVVRVTRRDGKVLSVTTNARYVSVRGVEEIKDYTPPTVEDVAKVTTASKLPPLVNFRTDGCDEMTKAEFAAINADHKAIRRAKATETRAAYRFRRHMNKDYKTVHVFLTDVKETAPPLLATASSQPAQPEMAAAAAAPAAPRIDLDAAPAMQSAAGADDNGSSEESKFEGMRSALKLGVQVVVAPQLFSTPVDLAQRMVELASIATGDAVLEPSAGTARILRAIREATSGGAIRTAVEINGRLCDGLRIAEAGAEVVHKDFLQCGSELGRFDAVIMNPPFVDASDIKHILHAVTMLKPGGRLVAICADGPRQNKQLRPLVDQNFGLWEQLPRGTFTESGTEVSTILLSFTV